MSKNTLIWLVTLIVINFASAYYHLSSSFDDDIIGMLKKEGYEGYSARSSTIPFAVLFGSEVTATILLEKDGEFTKLNPTITPTSGISFFGSDYYYEISAEEMLKIRLAEPESFFENIFNNNDTAENSQSLGQANTAEIANCEIDATLLPCTIDLIETAFQTSIGNSTVGNIAQVILYEKAQGAAVWSISVYKDTTYLFFFINPMTVSARETLIANGFELDKGPNGEMDNGPNGYGKSFEPQWMEFRFNREGLAEVIDKLISETDISNYPNQASYEFP